VVRRGRVRLPVWIASIVGFVLLSAVNLPTLYPRGPTARPVPR